MEQERKLNALEAITRLVATADSHVGFTRQMSELAQMSPEQRAELENIEMAISTVQAMLNTAMPIARFRCFVQIEAESKRRGGTVRDDYTICSVNIHGILAGLIGLHQTRTMVYVTLWEQKPMGAEMLTGYQGPSKTARYRDWVQSLILDYRGDDHGAAPQREDATDAGAEGAAAEDQAGTSEGSGGDVDQQV